jgi:hypothetical protein
MPNGVSRGAHGRNCRTQPWGVVGIEADHVTPVIDRTYPLTEAADAIRYLETGRARGKVVMSISGRTNGNLSA